jgi:hypothetical protein
MSTWSERNEPDYFDVRSPSPPCSAQPDPIGLELDSGGLTPGLILLATYVLEDPLDAIVTLVTPQPAGEVVRSRAESLLEE